MRFFCALLIPMIDVILWLIKKHKLIPSIALMIFLVVFGIDNENVSAQTVNYFWVLNTDTLAEMNVPDGFKESSWKYGEGVVTKLIYADSSFLLFHYGLDISLPLLKSPFYIVDRKNEKSDRTIRYGRLRHSELRWCEESFKIIPINIAFSRVPPKLFKIFEKSFSTFKVIKKF